jgi:hypothetical protein
MVRSPVLGFLATAFIGAAMAPAIAQSNDYPPPPPRSASNQDDPDMGCRQQAAAEAGYPESSGNRAPSRDVQQRYADAYYDCMRGGSGGPPPNAYAYGPPPAAYGPPPSYYYGPDPYAYPYYPPYYAGYPPYYAGPTLGFSFGFGGRGGRGGGYRGGRR